MSLRTPTTDQNRQTLLNLQNVQEQLAQDTQRISTGNQITSPGDDPTGTALILDFGTSIQANTQFLQQATSANSLLQSASDALSSVISEANSLQVLASEALSSSSTATSLAAIAPQVEAARSNLLSLANTQSQGKYVFAGTDTTTVPFTDAGAPAGAITYSGNSGVINLGVSATTTVATTITTAGTYRWSAAGYKYMRVQVTTTGTVLTVQGLSARLGTPSSPLVSIANANLPQNLTQIGGAAVSSTTAQLGINVVNVGGTAAAASIANGSTNKGLGTTQMTAVSQTDVNAGAFAGAGRVNGTVIASAQGGGAVVSAEINVSTLTLGTATSVFFTLQESNGGTNFTDIWVSDPITATGIVRVPAIPVAGRRRWSAFSVGGTSTTVTATITALELPAGSYPLMRQMRDAYAATNPFATQINSVATASTFVLGTISSSTTIFNIEGTKAFTAFMTLAGSPTVTTQPVVSVQGSMDGTNWVTITGATMTAAGNGTYATSVANTPYKYCKLTVTTAAAYSAGSYTISNIGVQAVN